MLVLSNTCRLLRLLTCVKTEVISIYYFTSSSVKSVLKRLTLKDRHRYFTTFIVENGEFISCHKLCKMEIYGGGRKKQHCIKAHEAAKGDMILWVEIYMAFTQDSLKMCANLIQEANQDHSRHLKSSLRGEFSQILHCASIGLAIKQNV
ncbi:hypothetical protein BCR42DRAFT_149288 [Absidia repens]|uniref:Uncharacterized protein n=1 Tax=Absidia repens TaxID=90262 RepID=A0A1X2I2C3_9FUNG|nr:hypothetical protein BCR42DRAFT_149288 [Absidia repens]